MSCFFFLILGIAIALPLLMAQGAKRRAERVEAMIEGLAARIGLMEARLAALKPERSAGSEVVPVAEARREEIPVAEHATAPPPAEPPAGAAETATPPVSLPAPPLAALAPPRPALKIDWENLIGVRLFSWLGGITLFIGAALFLQYSVQHNLLSPTTRVAIALLVGAAAVFGGDYLRERADRAGQALSGAGVAILYAALFAAHARYRLMGSTPTFAAMVFVSVVAGALALRRRAYVLAVIGLVGGFLTPYLLSTGEDHSLALFFYIALLDVGIVAVGRRREWPSLSLFGVLGTSAVFVGWATRFLNANTVGWSLVAAAVLGALFVLLQPWARMAGSKRSLASVAASLALTAPFLLVMGVAGESSTRVAPQFLVPYLLVLIGGTVFVSRQTEFGLLLPGAAFLTTMTLVQRVGSDLFPSQRTTSLILFALPALAFFGLWVARRRSPRVGPFRIAAAISLLGSLLVVGAVLGAEPKSEPIVPLLMFALVHLLAVVAIGGWSRQGFWLLLAEGYGLITLLALTSRFTDARLLEFVPGILISTAIFWLLPFVHGVFRSDRWSWLSCAAAPLLHYPILFILAKKTWGYGPLGAISILFGILGLVALRRALSLLPAKTMESRLAVALFGAVTLLFATAAIPILLEKQWITVAWALEAAALAWLYTRVGFGQVMLASSLLAGVTFIRLIANEALWSYHPRGGVPVLNWYLYTFGVPAIAFLFASKWARESETALRMKYPQLLKTAAGVLSFALLNVEIADYYSTGSTLTFRLSGAGVAEDLTYSLAWAGFAVALLILGIMLKAKPARAASLVVLAFAIGKVFLHDLWDLGALARVVSIVGLALSLLAVSFLMQRFVLVKDPA